VSLPRALPLLAASLLAAACDPTITALTTAPPTAVAEIDDWEKTARLSQGIAIAFECTFQNKPCVDAAATSSDPAIVRVFPGFVDMLAPGDAYQRPIGKDPRAVFILVGVAPGEASVEVTSDDADGALSVTILPPP
jgi:hypothetical protein